MLKLMNEDKKDLSKLYVMSSILLGNLRIVLETWNILSADFVESKESRV